LFDALLSQILAVHLMAVNLASAGPLVAVWLEWRGSRTGQDLLSAAGRTLARLALLGLVIGVTLGVGMLLIAWGGGDEQLRSMLETVPAMRWWYVGGEILFSGGCLFAYWWYWDRLAGRRVWHRVLGIVAGTNLLYHFPLLFTALSVKMSRFQLRDLELDRQLYKTLMFDPEVFSRVMHHWLAAFAVAGAAVIAIGLRLKRPTPEEREADSTRLIGTGSRIALLATVTQLPVGVWVLLQTPTASRENVLGGDSVTTVLFGVSILLALSLLQSLFNLAMGEITRGAAYRTIVQLVVVICLMTAVLGRMG